MALTFIALFLFLVMVAAWVVLPGSMIVTHTEVSPEPMSASPAGQTA